MEKVMSEHFNVEDAFNKEVRPLVEQAHAIARKHGVPMIFCAVVKNDDDGYEAAGSAHLNGPERTPPEFVIAWKFLREGMEVGVKMAQLVCAESALRALIEGGGDEQSSGDAAENEGGTIQ